MADARVLARKVLRALSAPAFEGLLPGGGATDGEAAFTLLGPAQLRSLCAAAARSLEFDDMVLSNIQPPVKIFGAIHGQLFDLLSHFKWQQGPLEETGDILYTSYVFLGDYTDRGANSLEVISLLMSLKVVHPNRIFLLRGHHESRHLNFHFGLKADCERRCGSNEGTNIYEQINRVFENMSLAAVIGGQVLALGPGVLPPSLTRLEQLRRYKKPLVLPHALQSRAVGHMDRVSEQVLIDLFSVGALLPRELGTVRDAAPEHVKTFCTQQRLSAIVRSRQVPAKGYAFECAGRLITITSCLNYCDLPTGNDAAVLCITKEEGSFNLQVRPKVITAQVGKLYRVLGRASKPAHAMSPRWPAQVRAATPGRVMGLTRGSNGDANCGAISDAAALLISQDCSVSADTPVALALFPAYGPGRLPGRAAPGGIRANAVVVAADGAAADDVDLVGDSATMQFICTGAGWGNLADSRKGAVGGPTEGAGACAQHRSGARSPSAERSRPSLGAASGGVAATAGAGGRDAALGAHVVGKANELPQWGPWASSPKSSQATTPTGASQRGAARRFGSDAPRGDYGSEATVVEAEDGTDRRDRSCPADVDALSRLLQDSVGLAPSALPSAPLQFLQTPRAVEQPIVLHLCRIWVEAGFGDREWVQALHTFEGHLSDQPRQRARASGGRSPTGTAGCGPDAEVQEYRWSLETFSMWLLKCGRLLRDCPRWFEAFDFDQDEMIGIADFLQGLVATAAPHALEPGTTSGLCVALAIFRLLNLEKRQSLSVKDLESICSDTRVSLAGPELALSMPQIARQATDFEFFCSLLLPRLQGAPAFRLRVFGQLPPDS